MKRVLIGTILVFAVIISGCQPEAAIRPRLPHSADQAAKQAFYQEHVLHSAHSWLGGYTFVRADGEYTPPQLEHLAAAYTSTQKLYDDSGTRQTVLMVPAAIGGGLVGYAAAGGTLNADERTGMLIAGGSVIALALIVEAVWADPIADFAEVYNQELARELGIPMPNDKAATNYPEVVVGLNGVGLRF